MRRWRWLWALWRERRRVRRGLRLLDRAELYLVYYGMGQIGLVRSGTRAIHDALARIRWAKKEIEKELEGR